MSEVISIFKQQAVFMEASGQTVGLPNGGQSELYAKLIKEEVTETFNAWNAAVRTIDSDTFDPVAAIIEVADGLIDTIYVCIGMMHSLGIDPESAWNEVHGSNLTKIDPTTGFVIRREDGKILKPESYRPPDLEKVIRMSWNIEEAA